MKKLISLIVALMASITIANAQFGIVGGLVSSTTSTNTEDVAKNFEGIDHYHLGIAYKFSLPLGLAIQPELIYQVKGAKFSDVVEGKPELGKEFDLEAGFAELGIGVQWGLNLIVARPFVFAKPYAGIAVTDFTSPSNSGDESGSSDAVEIAKNGLEYGISIGAGLEVFKRVQLSLEFYKNLGNLFVDGEFNGSADAATNEFTNIESYNGLKVTLGFFF